MSEALEHHEHAEHAVEGGKRRAALLIAVLAAGLALAEQGAKHAETKMSAAAIAAADLWGQYQAKSIRANQSRALADMVAVLPADPAAREPLVTRLRNDAARFETEPKDGKAAIAERAHAQEEQRDAAHEKLEAFDNSSAAFQLGIVLVTASVITGSTLLLGLGAALGLLGAGFGLAAMFAPALVAF